MRIILFFIILSGFFSCENKEFRVPIVNSESFPENQVLLGESVLSRTNADALNTDYHLDPDKLQPVGQLEVLVNKLTQSNSDSLWQIIDKNWEELQSQIFHSATDSSGNHPNLLNRWAGLNAKLLQYTGEIKFGDALEQVLYHSADPSVSVQLIKSVIYTHVFDRIYINLLGNSAVIHHHTTGGVINLTQETAYPQGSEILLKCSSDDARFLDVFIRIPSWAVNPTVTHGNVKYVAHPGEYCEISRKWKNGDEFLIDLKN